MDKELLKEADVLHTLVNSVKNLTIQNEVDYPLIREYLRKIFSKTSNLLVISSDRRTQFVNYNQINHKLILEDNTPLSDIESLEIWDKIDQSWYPVILVSNGMYYHGQGDGNRVFMIDVGTRVRYVKRKERGK